MTKALPQVLNEGLIVLGCIEKLARVFQLPNKVDLSLHCDAISLYKTQINCFIMTDD
jgi:hypothetical protein